MTGFDSKGAPATRPALWTDAELVSRADSTARREHDEGVRLLDLLNELDERRVCLALGYSSLFDLCTRRWFFSRAKAGRYIAVARAMKRHRPLRTLLERRSLTIGNAALLVGVLTDENSSELLRRASGRTYREIEELAFGLRPARPIRDTVRLTGSLTIRGNAPPPGGGRSGTGAGRHDVRPGASRIESEPLGSAAVRTDVHRAGDSGLASGPGLDSGANVHTGGSGASVQTGGTGASVQPGGSGANVHTGGDGADLPMGGCAAAAAPDVVGRSLSGCIGSPDGRIASPDPGFATPTRVSLVPPGPSRSEVAPVPSSDDGRCCVSTAAPESHTETRYEIRFAAPASLARKLDRVRAIRSDKASLGELFELLLDEYLVRNDPELRAQRRAARAHAQAMRTDAPASTAQPASGSRVERSCVPTVAMGPPASSRRVATTAGPALGAAHETAGAPIERAARPRGATGRHDEASAKPTGREELRSTTSAAIAPTTEKNPAAAPTRGSRTAQQPAPTKAIGQARASRYVPRAVRDAVFARDRGRCTFVGTDGVRCGSSHHLQVDHIVPFASGGGHDPANLRLLCGRHNRLEARRVLGAWGGTAGTAAADRWG